MADIHQPHDRLFRAVFSDPGEAVSLLQTALPDTLRHSFDWTTLTLVDGTFVDEDLQGSQSDLLYQVEHAESGQSVSVGAFRRRLEAVGADLPRVRFIGNEYDTTLDAVDTIRADIEAMPETPALVVFDTLAGFLPDRCDIERMAPARRLLRPLAALAVEKGISIVLLHHEGKGRVRI